MQLHSLNLELAGDELLSLVVIPEDNTHVSIDAITLKRGDILIKATLTGLGKTESHWVPTAEKGKLRLTLSELTGGMMARMMKKTLVVSLIAKAAGSQSGLSADGESLWVETAPLLANFGLKGSLTLKSITCAPAGLRLDLTGEAKIRKPSK